MKSAPENQKVVLTQASQFCLEAMPVINFIKSVPKGVKIGDLRIRGNSNKGRKAEHIDESLKKLGLQSVIRLEEPIEVRIAMKGVVNRDLIAKTINTIAKKYGLKPEKFYIVNVTLTNESNAASLTFRRMYKSIKLPNDKRKSKLVLGMQSGSGLDYHGFLADLSAKKITCTFGKVEKTIVMCSEETVVK